MYKRQGKYHGDNGYTSEVVKFYAGSSLLAQIDSNTTTQYWSWSTWQDVSFTVPDTYTGAGAASIKIEIRGRNNYVQIDDLRVTSYAYGSLESVLEPSMVRWDESGGVTQISLGARHSCALLSSGSVKCWGHNGGSYENILGSPSYKGESSYDPKEVDLSGTSSLVSSNWTSSTVDGINAGDGVTCAMMGSGEALCWGSSLQKGYVDPSVTTIASSGDVGRYPALTEDDDGNWIISYNDNGGLAYAKYNGTSWTTTEACPAAECDVIGPSVAVGPDGRVHISSYDVTNEAVAHTRLLVNKSSSLVDTGDNPQYMGMGVDTEGNRHVAYYDSSSRDMMYVVFNGTNWSTPEVIDQYSNNNKRLGESWNDLELDASNHPHVSYMYHNYNPNPDPVELKYAWHNGTDWITTTLQTITGNSPTKHSSLALDSSGNPHISYYDSTNDTLRYTYYNGSSWIDSTVTADDAYDRGRFNSIALDSYDYPRISYRNESSDDLEMASWDGASWSTEVIDSTNNVGSWTSIAIDSNDRTRIAYYYDSGSDLRYASHDGSSWTIQDIDTSSSSNAIRLELDAGDRPRIAYGSADDARLAYNNTGEGDVWVKVDVETSNDVGSHMALSLDDDGTAYMVHRDETNDELRHSVVYTGTVWRTETLASTGEVTFGNPGTSLSFVDDTMHMTYINATSGMLEHITQNPAGAASSVVDGDGFSVGLYTSIALDESGQQHVAYHLSLIHI